MLAALPSGGSDWFASCIATAMPERKYAREFFCPTVNWHMAPRLNEVVGDVLWFARGNLCRRPWQQQVDRLVAECWQPTGFTFTKENYLTFQLEQFAAHFSIVVLTRTAEETFPPTRHRVMMWYEHFYGALFDSGLVPVLWQRLATTPMRRAALGQLLFHREQERVARMLGLPVCRMRVLQTGKSPEVYDELRWAGPYALPLTEVVMATTRVTPRPEGEYQDQWKDAMTILTELAGCE